MYVLSFDCKRSTWIRIDSGTSVCDMFFLHLRNDLFVYPFLFVERTEYPQEYYHISVVPEKHARVAKLLGELSRQFFFSIRWFELFGVETFVGVVRAATQTARDLPPHHVHHRAVVWTRAKIPREEAAAVTSNDVPSPRYNLLKRFELDLLQQRIVHGDSPSAFLAPVLRPYAGREACPSQR